MKWRSAAVWAGAVLLLACCTVTVLVGLHLASGPLRVGSRVLSGELARPDRLRFDDLVTAVCTGALVVALLWLAGTTALATVAHLVRALAPAAPTLATLAVAAARLELASPLVIRRVVAAVLGLAVSAGAAGTAQADPGRPDTSTGQVSGPVGATRLHRLDGLALPDRAVGTEGPVRVASGAPRRHAATVVVAPGDSLWSISARLLGPGSSDREITAAWHRLHRANHLVLSADPDLIVPGTALLVPDLHPTAPTRKDQPR